MAGPRCKATAKSTQQQCTKICSEGFTVCFKHGAASPQAKAAAQVRVFEDRARRLIPNSDERRTIGNPFEELMELASEIVAFKDAVGLLVVGLEQRVTQLVAGNPDADQEEKIRPQILVYERALDRSANILIRIAQLGIEDRLARVSERQAETFAQLIDGIVTDLGHDPTNPAIAAKVARRLQLASAG